MGKIRDKQAHSRRQVEIVHVYPDVSIPEDAEFTEGVPTAMTVSVAAKVSTRPYESMDFFESITFKLKEGADVKKAADQAHNYILANHIAPRIKEVRSQFGKE